jgi:uncharacterized protein
MSESHHSNQKNVVGGILQTCCTSPMTGFFRTGCCETGPDDIGSHTVCVLMTEEFLAFSVAAGNDLVTPMPQYGFPGLVPGDRWCVCISRWRDALIAGVAAPIVLEATHERALDVVSIEDLLAHELVR